MFLIQVAESCKAHYARFSFFKEIGLPGQGRDIHEAEHTFMLEPRWEEGLDISRLPLMQGLDFLKKLGSPDKVMIFTKQNIHLC
jgi:hypothetical protein